VTQGQLQLTAGNIPTHYATLCDCQIAAVTCMCAVKTTVLVKIFADTIVKLFIFNLLSARHGPSVVQQLSGSGSSHVARHGIQSWQPRDRCW
jgi:hypothetical protein